MNCWLKAFSQSSIKEERISRTNPFILWMKNGQYGGQERFLRSGKKTRYNVDGANLKENWEVVKNRLPLWLSNKSNIRNRTHTHIRNRTHTMYFRVTKSYPTKTKAMAIYPCNGNKLTRDTGQGGKVAIWLRKRARIHVLPSCSGTRVKMVPLPVGHLPVYNLGEKFVSL